jgi:hypothetical protein
MQGSIQIDAVYQYRRSSPAHLQDIMMVMMMTTRWNIACYCLIQITGLFKVLPLNDIIEKNSRVHCEATL